MLNLLQQLVSRRFIQKGDRSPLLVLARAEDFYQWRSALGEGSELDEGFALLARVEQLIGLSEEDTQLIRLVGWERSRFLLEIEGSNGIGMLDSSFPNWRNSAIEPVPRPTPKHCLGCIDFHGRMYGGDFLVCGIHPQGWKGEGGCVDKRF